MHKIKKILIYLSICVGFIFCFLFGKYINTLALGNFNNSIGTIPIQMDIDNYNYNSPNLFDFSKIKFYNTNVTIDYNNQSITVRQRVNNTTSVNLKTLCPDMVVGETYTMTLKSDNGLYFYLYGTNNSWYSGSSRVITQTDLDSNLVFYGVDNEEIVIYDIMINKGNVKMPYEPFYKFGYNVSLFYGINSNSSTTVNYYFNEFNYTKTTSSVIGDYLIQNYYLPFNIDSKGYVSLPNINFGISSISNNSNSNTYSLQLELTPIINIYYKGNPTNNIYTKLNYMSNDLFFSGITFSGCNGNNCGNTINSGDLSLSNPKTLVVTELNDTGNISTTNISTYYNDDIKNRNYYVYNNYLNVSFKIGDLAENYNYINGRNYTFGISSLASRIIDNQTTTTPLPDNELTSDKYNTCSAWYDIPCQLGNAVTYIIYEAPIISPIINFFDGFIDLVQSFITYITWFEGLGLIFGVFIVIFFIRMIILLVKGGNDD